MHIEFSYNKADVLNALRYHFMQKPEIRLFRNILLLLLLVTIVATALNLVLLNALMGIFAMVTLILTVFWYVLPISIYNRAATFKDHIRLHYSEEGLIIYSYANAQQRELSWSKFTRTITTSKFLYLYRDKKSFFLVPTNAFENEDAKGEFIQLLRGKIPNSK